MFVLMKGFRCYSSTFKLSISIANLHERFRLTGTVCLVVILSDDPLHKGDRGESRFTFEISLFKDLSSFLQSSRLIWLSFSEELGT
jgi:hypothetical protein